MHFIMSLYISCMMFPNNSITFHHHIMGINASWGTCITSHVGFFQLVAYHAWYSLIASTYKWVSASWTQTCIAIVVFSHSGMYIVFFNPYHASHLIWINRLCKRGEGNKKGCYILSHLFFSQIIKFTSLKKRERIMWCHTFLGSNV